MVHELGGNAGNKLGDAAHKLGGDAANKQGWQRMSKAHELTLCAK